VPDLPDDDLPGLEPDEQAAEPEAPTPPPEQPTVPPESHQPADDSPPHLGSSYKLRLELGDFSTGAGSRWVNHKKEVLAGAAILGALALFVVSTNGAERQESEAQSAVQTEPLAEVGEAVESDDLEELKEAVESDDLEAIIGSPLFLECPPDFQQDVLGRYLSGDQDEAPEQAAETPEDKDSNQICNRFNHGSYVFTMIVEGDGETRSQIEDTFYEVRFFVNNEWPNNEFYDNTGFEVFVTWNHLAEEWAVTLKDAERAPITDFEAEIEWLDQSTLEVHVTLPDDDVVVNEVRTELNVFVSDDDGKVIYERRDIAEWTAARIEG